MNATENTNTRKSLKDRAREFSVQLPFMEGRDKGNTKDLIGKIVTIVDYGFLNGENDRNYVVFITKENEGLFYFGGAVLTDQLEQLEADGYRSEILEEGLPMLMRERKSKNNRTYTNVEFYPEG